MLTRPHSSQNDPERLVIYPARLVRTMDPSRPTGSAIAVQNGRIRAVGDVEELAAYGNHMVDARYSDKVLVPGFVEAHSHAGSGGQWKRTYLGRFGRYSPDGRWWPGCKTIEDILDRLRKAAAELPEEGTPLLGWGLDPIYYEGPILARELDTVSTTRPINITHANGHLAVVNSVVMRRVNIDETTMVEGVEKDEAGRPTGELREFAAMSLVHDLYGGSVLDADVDSIRGLAQDGVNTGTTTVTDLGSTRVLSEEGRAIYREAAGENLGVRLDVFHFGAGFGGPGPEEAAPELVRLRDEESDAWLRFGNVKLMLDGSIQGFTARLMEPGYLTTERNGLWVVALEEFRMALEAFHAAGLLVHTHCNGDQATEVFVRNMEQLLTTHPRWDHRHTVTHSQMTTQAQYRRMAALGMGANIFANHLWSWGDQHWDITVGPDRARRMNAAASALAAGVPITLHSDTPVTPLGPLSSIKHAVTRLAPSGRVIGEQERISAGQALRAVTIGAAYLLKRDHEIGSLEAGKWADVAVLDADPLSTPAEKIEGITVCGTMVGGIHHASTVHS